MSFSLDQTDEAIMYYLKQNARESYSAIARSLNVSEGTVRSRINKMLEDEVFEYVIHTDPKKIGLDVQAIFGINTRLGMQDTIAEKLQAFDSVRFVGAFSGTHDLMLQAYFSENDDLVSFINTDLAALDGIIDIDVNVELKQYKDSFTY
ncbi:AsnC family transcriptional regulator [Sinobaca qinghaiensis]|uniref:AsnC family transcriptional regulator n=1 Tax=Sinobaca qinghaiensis TaxID=342944 RepID=A0A419UWM5_9BACL|nr:Lrp/AsnC family transcriptional regulator [Sinobaca qinghaiensis]RKD69537.1 AsnC family transcriptional regulator [Sinobaca qinghaiensis]